MRTLEAGQVHPRVEPADDADDDREHRDRHPRLAGRPPRPRRRAGRRVQGHLHEHPHHQRAGRALRRPTGPATTRSSKAHRDPARRPGVPLRHAHVHRHRDRRAEDGTPRSRSSGRCPWATTSPAPSRCGTGHDRPMSSLSGRAAIVGHRRHRVLQGVRPLRAPALGRGGPRGARRLRAHPCRRRRPHDLHDGHLLGDRGRPRARHGRPAVLHPDQLRRRRGLRHRPAGGDGGRDRRRRRRGLLPRLQRALRDPVRPGLGRRGDPGQHQRARQRLELPVWA